MNALMNEYIARKITEINTKNDDIAHYMGSMPKGVRVHEEHDVSIRLPKIMRWAPRRKAHTTIS